MAGAETRLAVGAEARPATGHPVRLLRHRSPGSAGKLRLNSRTLGSPLSLFLPAAPAPAPARTEPRFRMRTDDFSPHENPFSGSQAMGEIASQQ
uniref:Uncharacterized protein n=1 Tax=Oryza rufipogon TaxID=4529 RepID=A0A0E0QJP8_ORYRU